MNVQTIALPRIRANATEAEKIAAFDATAAKLAARVRRANVRARKPSRRSSPSYTGRYVLAIAGAVAASMIVLSALLVLDAALLKARGDAYAARADEACTIAAIIYGKADC